MDFHVTDNTSIEQEVAIHIVFFNEQRSACSLICLHRLKRLVLGMLLKTIHAISNGDVFANC